MDWLPPPPSGHRPATPSAPRTLISLFSFADPKPTVTSVIVTAGDFKEDLRSEPEQGAAAGEHGPLDDEHRKIGGDGGGSEESGRQPQEPAHAANEGPQPQDRRRRFHATRSPGCNWKSCREFANVLRTRMCSRGKRLAVEVLSSLGRWGS